MEKQVKRDNVSLHYYTQGDPGHTPIVFLHPAFGDHTCFHHQADVFARDHHVLCVDMLGHGRSQVGQGNVTIDRTVGLAADMLAAEGHTSAHLVGVSLGALLAQAIADQHPRMVKTLTVVGGYSLFGDNSAITRAQGGEMVRWLLLALVSMERFRRYVASQTNFVDAEREVFYRAARHFTRRSFQVMPGMGKLLDRTPRRLPQPMLIVVGEHDRPVIREHARAWREREPDRQLHILPAAGHCANMDNPAEFNRLLAGFLASQVCGGG